MCNNLLFLFESSRDGVGFSLAVLVSGFCVNLQKEVTAGCLANSDVAQWESSTLEYESLQLSRVFVLRLIWYHPSPSSHVPFCATVIPPFFCLRTFHLTLLYPCDRFSLCNFPSWWTQRGVCGSVSGCLVLLFSSIHKKYASEITCPFFFHTNMKIPPIL